MTEGLNITEASVRGDYFVGDEGKGIHLGETLAFRFMLILSESGKL